MKLNYNLNWAEYYERTRGFIRAARLSLFESVFLIAAITFALIAAFFYLTKIPPRQFELHDLEQREQTALARLSKLARDRQRIDEQRANAEQIVNSLGDFEARLRDDRRGKIEIIDEINRIARVNRVTASGFSYQLTPTAEVDEKGNLVQGGVPRENANIYPMLGIDTTVNGDYRDLRRFIADLEQSSRFVIIKGVAFQGEAEQAPAAPARPGATAPAAGQPPAAAPAPPRPAAPREPGTIQVSLKIEMETYFQRAAPTPPPVGAPSAK